jgi:hypothetical protein
VICDRCGYVHACSGGDRDFPLDAMIYLLHYGDGLSIVDIASATGRKVGQVAATIREMDSAIMRSATRPRRSVLSFKDAVGQLVASEILTDAAHRVDPEIRHGLKPRLTFAEMSRRAKIAHREARQYEYDRLKLDAADLMRTYWLYQPEFVLQKFRELIEAEKKRREPTVYTVPMSCTSDGCGAQEDVWLETVAEKGTAAVRCKSCQGQMVVSDHRVNPDVRALLPSP